MKKMYQLWKETCTTAKERTTVFALSPTVQENKWCSSPSVGKKHGHSL